MQITVLDSYAQLSCSGTNQFLIYGKENGSAGWMSQVMCPYMRVDHACTYLY